MVEAPSFAAGGGKMGALLREHDWSRTALGPLETWPQSLRTTVGLILHSVVPIVLLWGEDGIMIYNDAYSVFAGGRHPALFGSKVREGWPEVADFNDNVMKVGLGGGTLAYQDQELTLYRTGRAEQVWMNLDYSPVSDERGNPPSKFAAVFARARAEGYRLTMHCDVDQEDAVGHIWQALDDIGVERIDHGVNCLEDAALVSRLAADRIGLTVCPVSNRFVTDGLKSAELKTMLNRSLRATVNSDDPAYFEAYVNENFAAVAADGGLTTDHLTQLARNSFEIAWLEPAERAGYVALIDSYVTAGLSGHCKRDSQV